MLRRHLFFILMPIFLFLMTLNSRLDYFFAQRAGVEWAVFGLITIAVWKRYGPLVGILVGYLGFSVINVVFWHNNQFATMGELRPVIHRSTLLGAFSTLTIIGAVWLKPISRELMTKLFLAFGVFICVQFWVLSPWWYSDGILMTKTLCGVYLVLCLPIIPNGSGAIWALFALTIVGTGGHACILALAAYMTGVLWVRMPQWLPKWIACLVATLGLVWLWKGTAWLFRDHGRSEVWRIVFKWWGETNMLWFGTGAGTWYSLAPWIQQSSNTPTGGYYVYAHQEYLEILFTLGIVGLVLFLTFWFVSVVRSYRIKDHRAVGFLFALAASSLSMFPLRLEAVLFLVIFNLYPILESSFLRRQTESYE